MSRYLHASVHAVSSRKRSLILSLRCDPSIVYLVPVNETLTVNKTNKEITARHFAAYREDILRFLRSRVNSHHHAEDLLQQVFLRLVQRADWSQIQNPEGYMYTTARHVLSDFYRQRGARDHGVVVDFNEFEHKDETWSPARSMRSEDFLKRLAGVLESLSPQVRKAFVLSKIYGYTISPRTVEKHVAKGLARCFEDMMDVVKNGKAVDSLVE